MGEDWLNTKANVSLVHSTCMITAMLSAECVLEKDKSEKLSSEHSFSTNITLLYSVFLFFFCALSMLVITIESADVWNDHVVVVCALESQKMKLVLNSSSVYLAPHFFSGQ